MTRPEAKIHHVLLVEDSAADAFLMKAALEYADVPLHFQVAEDGLFAMQFLAEAQRRNDLPDLMLLDLNMPRMNGFEVLEALKNTSADSLLPVVVLTTSDAAVDRERAQHLGAQAFVTKPHGFEDMARLLRRIGDVLSQKAAWQTLEGA